MMGGGGKDGGAMGVEVFEHYEGGHGRRISLETDASPWSRSKSSE